MAKPKLTPVPGFTGVYSLGEPMRTPQKARTIPQLMKILLVESREEESTKERGDERESTEEEA